MSEFKYREREVFEVLHYLLLQEKRSIIINGWRGIGKSSLAKYVQHYMAERKMCTSGNIYIDCKNISDLGSLLK